MQTKLKRAAALALVIIMLGLVVLTLFFAVTGSRYFMASMVSMLVLPVLVYAYMLVYRIMHKDADQSQNNKKQ